VTRLASIFKPQGRLTVTLGLVLVCATAPLLSACTANPVHSIVSGATGGSVDVGGTRIPKDFPTSVPLAKGTVTSATAVGSAKSRVFNISIRVSGPETMTSIEAALKKAGFSIEAAGSIGKIGGSLISTGKKFSVAVVLAKSGKGYQANYTVAPADLGT
jgi:hypothetical protein